MKNTLRDRLQEIIKHSMNSPPARATGMQGTKEIIMGLAVAAGLMFTQTMMAAGPSPVDMKTSAHFTILAASAITGTPACTIIGDVGQTPTTGAAITGLLSSQLNGTIYAVDAGGPAGSVMNPAMLTAAQNDLNTAYFDAAGRLPTPTGLFLDPGAGDIGGMNLAPGLYKFTTTASITAGNVTLTGGPSDVWIFQIGTNLAMTAGLKVVLAGGAQANNIFWQVGTQATIGASADFKGTIMAAQAITVGATTTIEGRLMARIAAITFAGASCNLPPNAITATAGPNGSISPPGTISVAYHGNQAFSIVAVPGYHVLDVLVDSVSIGAPTSHTFTDVIAPHTISTTFEIDDPNIAKVAADMAALLDNDIKGFNPDLAHITVALTNPLPSSGSVNASTITWSSGTPAVVSDDGQTINRPAFTSNDVVVTFTATLVKGVISDTKPFALTVLKSPPSDIATVTSATYTVSIGAGAKTITAVPFNTSRVVFLAALAKSEANQTWNSSAISNPVVSGNMLVVTAQDEITALTYTVTVDANPDIAKVAADKAALVDAMIRGLNPDLAHITVALTKPLPSSGSINASAITWSSGTTAVVSNNGQTINRPVYASGDATVIFTATLSRGAAIATKQFTLKVLKLPPSTIATVTSATYAVSVAAGAKTIAAVTFNTSKVAFLAALAKGEANQTWNSNSIANPVVYGNKLVVTAQDGTTVVTYTVTVDVNPDIAKAEADKAALVDSMMRGSNPDLAHITVALTNPLPSIGSVNASTITWSSGTPAVVSTNGQTINRPTFVSGDATVIFTATLTKGMAIATKPFVLTVLQLSASRIATVTSAIYSVSVAAGAKTISGVPFNTSKVAFLAALVKGEPNQTWNSATIANPVVYGNKLVITAQDGITVVTYTVIVVKAPASSGKAITSFKILGNGRVDEETKTVAVTVPFNTNLTALVPTISVSPLAEINPLSGVVQDFTNPVLYPVTAEDFSIQNYTVTVFKSSSSTLAPVDLGSNVNFVILAGAAVTSTGGGTINGDVGASPIAGSAIGVTDAQVNGIIYAVDASGPAGSVVDPVLLTAAKDYLTIAYNDAAGRTPVPTGSFLNPNGGNIGGLNLVPGLYKFTTSALITGSDVTLTGGPNDVWIFQCAQDLQVGSGIKVILAGGARARNIFWQVGTSAVLGTSSVFKGTIMADQSITMNTSSTMEGRALAFSAEVAFNGDIATLPQDDGGMYLSKMRGSINWAKHAAGISDDRLSISGMINPRGGSSKLTGATAVLRVSGIQLMPAVAMDSNGKASGVINGITYKFKFDWLHGSYSFDIKGLDLRTAIGVPNTTAMILYDLPLRLTIEGAGLDIPLVLGTFECPCSTKIDKASSLTFNSTSNITLTGLYNCNKTQVNQQKQQGGDVFNVKVTGVIEADGGGEVAPTGDITIKIGDATSVIIFAQMIGSGAKWTYKSKAPGITSFIIDNNNHTFTMLASRIAGTNIPLNDPGAPTSYQMQIQLQVPTAVETMIFSSTVEILRKNSTSKTWSR